MIKHMKLSLLVDGFYESTGFTNIFKYIKNQPLPKDSTTFKKAQKQLKIIHAAGFIHRDIAERNLLYSRDGEVYIIDFSSASYEPDNEAGRLSDMRNLEYIFKESFI